MASLKTISFLFLVLILISDSSTALGKRIRDRNKPCKRLVVYFHDILFTGKNAQNSTSVIVGAPAWGNKTALANPFRYGDLVAFDDPITLDKNLHSTPVGRAQGFYLYTSKSTLAAWFSVSFVFNSTEHKGSINFAGNEYILQNTRDISITGGTGDFFMARGIASLMTDAYEKTDYFRLRVDIKLYECW